MPRKATPGSFKRGDPRAGRPAGVPNRATSEVREAFARLIEDNTPKLQAWLDATADKDPSKAIDLVARLAEFIVPKLSRSELRGADGDGRLVIHIVKQGAEPPAPPT